LGVALEEPASFARRFARIWMALVLLSLCVSLAYTYLVCFRQGRIL
jgi:hypothetical protein